MPFDPKDPEAKAAIDAAVAEAIAAATAPLETSIAKLTENNGKLTSQLRDARKSNAVDPEEHAKVVEQLEKAQGALDATTKDFTEKLSDATKQTEQLTKQLSSETAFTQKLLVDNGLTESLVKAGVRPALMPAVKALLGGQVQVVAEGETRKALIGDKPIADFVSTWVGSDEGKHFVDAPANGGGGSSGNASHDAGQKKTILASDSAAISSNLEAVAKGQVNIATE